MSWTLRAEVTGQWPYTPDSAVQVGVISGDAGIQIVIGNNHQNLSNSWDQAAARVMLTPSAARKLAYWIMVHVEDCI